MKYSKTRIIETIKHPKRIFHYIIKERALKEILPECNKADIKRYLQEAKNIGTELDNVITQYKKYVYNLEVPFLETSIIYTCVRALKPQVVIETGVSNGIFTHFILKALDKNGHGKLYSIDIRMTSSAYPSGKKTGWLAPPELRNRWEFLLGDSREILPILLSKLQSIDIFIHDSDHTYDIMSFEFKTAWKKIKNGGILISDDINSNNAFKDFISVNRKHITKVVAFSKLGLIRKI